MRPMVERTPNLRARRPFVVVLGALLAAPLAIQPLDAAGNAAPTFETQVLPLLQARCLTCHAANVRQAGLSLETREDVLKGGKSGPAIIARKPAESLILSMIATGKMPFGAPKLSSAEIEIIRRWIEAGALRDGETEQAAAVVQVSEREVQTILTAKCWVCHGRKERKAGLDLRTRASMLKGGITGPALTPGKPDDSLIIRRIATQQMPPPELQEQYSVRGLNSDELEKVRVWIAAGAPPDNETPVEVDVRTDPLIKPQDREFWSFRPPQLLPVPAVRDARRVRTPIDAFVLEKLEANGQTLAEDADRRVLMRRTYFDLTGLPPSPEEVEQYLADTGPDAYEHLIDRLLESPHYGERWGQYWLEAVGYADSEGGGDTDAIRPDAWRYRDFVIRSFNSGEPYDRFLRKQIAGDELFDYKAVREYTPEQVDTLAATGFWRMGPDGTYNTEQNFITERMDVIAFQMDILGTAVMGLSLGCARCHDHKYDPIPQRDYYRMVATLTPAFDPFVWLAPNFYPDGVGAKWDDTNTRFIPLLVAQQREGARIHNEPIEKKIKELEVELEERGAPYRRKLLESKLARIPVELREDLLRTVETPEVKRTDLQKYLFARFRDAVTIKPDELEEAYDAYKNQKEEINKRIAAEKEKLEPDPRIRALFDLGAEPPPTRMLFRGDPATPGPLVTPGVLSVLSAELPPYRAAPPSNSVQTSGRRLALANWLTQPNHPLTARVMINRIWQHHFGAGLVDTPGNFGRMGAPPANQKLLDWLATEFVRSGWDIKAMHRLIMRSSVYRQTSRTDESQLQKDPGDVLLSRYALRRLDSDVLRDSILSVAGRLDATLFGPADPINVKPDGEVIASPGKNGERRTLYLTRRRTRPVSLLETFDQPFLNPNCVRRSQSTVSSQALQLMNSDFVRDNSRYMAGRIIDFAGDDPASQVERLYLATLARKPTDVELKDAQGALAALASEWTKQLQSATPAEPIKRRAAWLALATLCHTMLNSAEFLYVD
jgi:hypothetical protein